MNKKFLPLVLSTLLSLPVFGVDRAFAMINAMNENEPVLLDAQNLGAQEQIPQINQEAANNQVNQEAVDNQINQEAVDNQINLEAVDNQINQEAVDNQINQEAVDNQINRGNRSGLKSYAKKHPYRTAFAVAVGGTMVGGGAWFAYNYLKNGSDGDIAMQPVSLFVTESENDELDNDSDILDVDSKN